MKPFNSTLNFCLSRFINDYLSPPFPSGVYLWIGLHGNYNQDLRYHWINGEELNESLAYWEFGQPNNFYGKTREGSLYFDM